MDYVTSSTDSWLTQSHDLQRLKDRGVWGALGIAVMLNTGEFHCK